VTAPASLERAPALERRIVFMLAAVQFVNILDFMIVMPMGPDFATALGIPTSRLGIIGGSYTAAAAVAGLVGAQLLDRFDRRRALAVCMLGLVAGTATASLASSFAALVGARLIAGLFGGPATSVAFAILTDVVPPQRRGRAMGAVMGAFSIASVVGVPIGLELSRLGGWRTPFYAVATLGLLVGAAVFLSMPPQRGHLGRGAVGANAARSLGSFLADRKVQLAFAAVAAAALGMFAVIPNLAAFLMYNLGYPRAHLSWLYCAGGAVSFFAMRAAGRLIDRRGPLPAVWFGTIVTSLLFAGGFIPAHTPLPVPLIFVGFMLGNSVRMVGVNTLTSKIPAPAERARYMSVQSAVQHLASALGAGLSSAVLFEHPNHALGGMPRLAILAIALGLALPFLLAAILRRLAPALSSARDEGRAPAGTRPASAPPPS
jgi:predicted MFS family arabinose efflux permease